MSNFGWWISKNCRSLYYEGVVKALYFFVVTVFITMTDQTIIVNCNFINIILIVTFESHDCIFHFFSEILWKKLKINFVQAEYSFFSEMQLKHHYSTISKEIWLFTPSLSSSSVIQKNSSTQFSFLYITTCFCRQLLHCGILFHRTVSGECSSQFRHAQSSFQEPHCLFRFSRKACFYLNQSGAQFFSMILPFLM